MRLVVGLTLVLRAIGGLLGELVIGPAPLLPFQVGLGTLLLAGLWTPLTGTLVGILQIGYLLLRTGDPWIHVLLATFGIALALLGPGAWSVDARLFGWKRIDIRDRRSHSHVPPES